MTRQVGVSCDSRTLSSRRRTGDELHYISHLNLASPASTREWEQPSDYIGEEEEISPLVIPFMVSCLNRGLQLEWLDANWMLDDMSIEIHNKRGVWQNTWRRSKLCKCAGFQMKSTPTNVTRFNPRGYANKTEIHAKTAGSITNINLTAVPLF